MRNQSFSPSLGLQFFIKKILEVKNLVLGIVYTTRFNIHITSRVLLKLKESMHLMKKNYYIELTKVISKIMFQ